MEIKLNQIEIETALHAYLAESGISTEGKDVTFAFSQRRQPTSELVADVDISSPSDAPKKAPKPPKKPVKKQEKDPEPQPDPEPATGDELPGTGEEPAGEDETPEPAASGGGDGASEKKSLFS